MKLKTLFTSVLFLVCGLIGFAQTFTNTSSYNFTNGTVYTTTFNVSGVNSGDILRQVNLKFGDGAMYSAELTRAVITLRNPAGTIVTLLDPNNFNTSLSTTDADRKYVDITLRDHAELNTPKGWADATGNYISNAYPFNYGYWRIPTPGAYSNFTGTHNGTWTLSISYPGLSTSYARKYISSELVFGDEFSFTDIRVTKPNQSCDTKQCIQTGEIYLASNIGYPENQPYTPTIMGGGSCQWNLIANNTAWFYFTASSSTVKFSISGMTKKIESVVATSPNCQGFTLINGGCPTVMYQGTANPVKYYKQSYAAGYSQNHGYELSGLTIGEEYILIIDGMDESSTGTASNFYIEVESGADDGCCEKPDEPSPIVGELTVCSGDDETYSVTNVTGAVYDWTFTGSGTIVGNGTNSISLNDITSGGTLSVVVTSDCGDSPASTIEIIVSPAPDQPSAISGELTVCSGDNETYSVTNVAGATYDWTFTGSGTIVGNGTNSISLNNITSGGTLSVIVTSDCGDSPASTIEITIIPIPVQPSAISGELTVCSGDNETYSVTNVAGATYDWTFTGGGTIVGNGTSSISLNDITSGGTLSVIVTSDCGNSPASSIEITFNTVPNAPTGPVDLDTVCYGDNATYTVDFEAGTTYTWAYSGTGVIVESGNSIDLENITTSGDLTVTSSNECGVGGTFTIGIHVNPIPAIQAGALEDVVCEGDTLFLGVYGGAAEWTGPNGFVSDDEFPVIPNVTTDNAGVYTVAVFNKFGCSADTSFTVVVNDAPIFTASATQYEICEGGSTTISVTGEAGLTYSWDNGLGTGVSHVVSPTSSTDYIVTAANTECQKSDTISIIVVPNVVPTFNLPETICEGEILPILPTTSIEGVEGTWNPTTVSNATSLYTFTPNATQCPIDAVDYTIEVKELPVPVITGPSTYCQGTTVSLSTTQTYAEYAWTTGSTAATITNITAAFSPITVTVTDEFGCVGTSTPFELTESTVTTTNQVITICVGDSALIHGTYQHVAGPYTADFVSAEGCDSISNVILTVNPLPEVTITYDESVCEGSNVLFTATGGGTYVWTTPLGGMHTGANLNVTNAQTANAGTYELTVTNNGCAKDTSVTLTIVELPSISITSSSPICVGETLQLEAEGGTTYTWTNPNGDVTNSSIYTVPNATSADAGSYTVSVMDNGCTKDSTFNVVIVPTPTITFVVQNPVVCGEDGILTLNFANVPDGDYTINYDGGSFDVTILNNTATTTVAPGTYSNLTIEIGNCESALGVTVVVDQAQTPAAPTVSTYPATCEANGYAIIDDYDASVIYLFNPATATLSNDTIFSGNAGTFTVWYISNGCVSEEASFIIDEQLEGPELPELNIATSCDSEGAVTILNYDATNNYTFSEISLGINAEGVITGGEVGVTYELTVSDGNCDKSILFEIPAQLESPTVTISSEDEQTAICLGESIALTANGASTYLWDNDLGSSTTVIVSPTETTTYSVVGTNEFGCIDSTDIAIVVNENPSLAGIANSYFSCYGSAVTMSAGELPTGTTATWTFNDEVVATGNTYEIKPVSANNVGNYYLTITSAEGCSSILKIILVGEACGIVIPSAISPDGDGLNDSFVIDGLAAYPNSEIWIYNRWGNEVFYSNDYQNDWDGRSLSKLNVGGDELPEGTYYYLVKLGGVEGQTGAGEIHKGFVYLKR
ncbi:MAG TPA: gliding motility-associated C-terminal domain-containing protein [Brumimicrobium sp.]|nr:gliding motility-associated C-terminal domain-containing protein [Brumimicrobium sp.]